jgi:hypothetical protein
VGGRRFIGLVSAVIVSIPFVASALGTYPNPDAFALERSLSKIVAVGVVQGVRSSLDASTGSIVSEYDFKVESVEKGSISGRSLRFVSYGGQYGDMMQFANGYPKFSVGESVRVFLADSPSLGLSVLGGPGLKSKQVITPGPSGISPAAGANAQGYSFSGKWWTISSVGYYINQAGTADIPAGSNDEFAGLKQATWNWWIDPGAYLTFPYWGTTTSQPTVHDDNRNVVGWVASLPGGIIAQATCRSNPFNNNLLECDIEMNDSYLWGMNGEWDRMDVTGIGVHEFGHWLALNDLYGSDDSTQTMYGYSLYGDISKRTIEWGDAMGIRFIYDYWRHAFDIGDVSPNGGDVDSALYGGVANMYDLLIAWVENPQGENRIKYRLGYDPSAEGGLVSSWGSVQTKPDWVGSETADLGAASGSIDSQSGIDQVFFWVDDPPGENYKKFHFGWNLDSNGYTQTWSSIYQAPGWAGSATQGAGVAIANIGGTSRPDLVLAWLDVLVGGGANVHYQIGWDFSTSGVASSWTDPIFAFAVPYYQFGLGVRLADIDFNGRLDMVVSHSEDRRPGNDASYRIGWDISSSGIVSGWSRGFDVRDEWFSSSSGNGVAIMSLATANANALEICFIGVHNVAGTDYIYYVWG